MTDRERFEALISGPLYRRSVARYDDNDTHQWAGRYICPTTQLAWEVWQAAQREIEARIQRALDHYTATSELHTSWEQCAGNMAACLREDVPG